MNKKIALSVLVILAVVALTATAVWAYFSNTEDRLATVGTASIDIGETTGFPLNFSLMFPGQQQSRDISIINAGTGAADFYVQLIGDAEGFNYCFASTSGAPLDVLRLSILDFGPDPDVWRYDASICPLYPGQAGSIIVPLAYDVAPGVTRSLRIYLTLAATAGNEFQGKSNTDTVHLIAVQHGGPAPVPGTTGFPTMNPWPTDDPNYGP